MALNYREDFATPSTGLRPVFIGLGTVTSDTSARFPEHSHQHYELIVPVRGPYRCHLNGRTLSLAAHTYLLVVPGDRHEDEVSAGNEHWALWFALPGPALLVPNAERVVPRTAELSSALTLLRDTQAHDPLSSHARSTVAELCVWRLIAALPATARSPLFAGHSADADFRAALTRLFERHADQALTLRAMAATLQCSERTLTTRCRALLGVSPQVAFLAVRLERAHQLLATTDQPIKAIAAACGFNDQFHFSRAFKKRFGTPPSAGR